MERLNDDVTGIPLPDYETSTQALNDILETDEGHFLADKLKNRMQELSERYKSMGPEERAKFEKEIVAQFQGNIDKLRKVVTEKISQGPSVKTEAYSLVALQVFGVIVLISVIGFFAYRLIKYIEKKEEPKMGRQEKKKALKAEKKVKKSSSPAGSPKAQTNQSTKTAGAAANGNNKKKSKAA